MSLIPSFALYQKSSFLFLFLFLSSCTSTKISRSPARAFSCVESSHLLLSKNPATSITEAISQLNEGRWEESIGQYFKIKGNSYSGRSYQLGDKNYQLFWILETGELSTLDIATTFWL
jgi:hypothetical protein